MSKYKKILPSFIEVELICRFSQLITLATEQCCSVILALSQSSVWVSFSKDTCVLVGRGFEATVNRFFVEFEFMICFPAASFMSFVPKIVRTCVNL